MRAVGDMLSCSQRSDEMVTTTVNTLLELRTSESFLRVRTEFDNQSRDHRLRPVRWRNWARPGMR